MLLMRLVATKCGLVIFLRKIVFKFNFLNKLKPPCFSKSNKGKRIKVFAILSSKKISNVFTYSFCVVKIIRKSGIDTTGFDSKYEFAQSELYAVEREILSNRKTVIFEVVLYMNKLYMSYNHIYSCIYIVYVCVCRRLPHCTNTDKLKTFIFRNKIVFWGICLLFKKFQFDM